MKNYVTLERSRGVDKDALVDSAYEKYDKLNVDKNGNYIKYSDLENNFDGVSQMYEGVNDLEDALIDYIEVIKTVKGLVKDKMKNGNFKTDEKVKDKMFYEVQDLQTYANKWLPDYSGNVISGFNKLVGDTDEEHFHQL